MAPVEAREPPNPAMPVETITNFLPIDDRIASAGQPSEDELRQAAEEGFGVVVNLGLLDPRYCLDDEAGLVASLGLAYHHIPVQFDAPTVDDFRAFVDAMESCREERVLVHCAANYRVSSFLAVYGEMKLGWDRARSDAHARALWPLNETWAAFLDQCRREMLGQAKGSEG